MPLVEGASFLAPRVIGANYDDRSARNPTGVRGTRTGINREQQVQRNATFATPTGPGPGGAPAHVPGQSKDFAGKTVEGGAENLPGAPTTSGSQSGPGILENWFNQRATGTDPAFEYALKRGGNEIDTRMSAGGSFNSGARGLQLSDMAANMAARRSGQLDQLAAGASSEHLGRLGLMFNQGLGLASGASGLASAYDLGAAGNMQAATDAQRQLAINKYGIDSAGNQNAVNTITGIWGGGNKK